MLTFSKHCFSCAFLLAGALFTGTTFSQEDIPKQSKEHNASFYLANNLFSWGEAQNGVSLGTCVPSIDSTSNVSPCIYIALKNTGDQKILGTVNPSLLFQIHLFSLENIKKTSATKIGLINGFLPLIREIKIPDVLLPLSFDKNSCVIFKADLRQFILLLRKKDPNADSFFITTRTIIGEKNDFENAVTSCILSYGRMNNNERTPYLDNSPFVWTIEQFTISPNSLPQKKNIGEYSPKQNNEHVEFKFGKPF